MSLIVFSLYNRHSLAVKEFIFGLLALSWWVYCQAFELMALTLPVKLFWANLLYVGAGLSSFAYLMLSMRFTGYDRLLTTRNISIVLGIIAVFVGLIFTDQYHGLMRTNFYLDTSGVPYIIGKDYGMLYPLYMLFMYGMNLTSMGLMLITVANKSSVYRRKAQILLVGLSIIPLSNLSYILGVSPVDRFDITPAFFWVSALIVSWGIFQHRLLNITPIARDLLVERMSTGIIVTDNSQVLVDINGAALMMFDLDKPEVIGKRIFDVPGLAENLRREISEGVETIPYRKGDGNCLYEVERHLLREEKGKIAGVLWVIDDVTDAHRNMEKIVEQERTLTAMHERERMARSLHDGLGQVFGYYNTQGQAVREYLVQEKYPLAMKHLADLIEVSRNHHLMIREQISEIRGTSVANRSFTSALKQYVANFMDKYCIPVTISIDDDLPADFPQGNVAVELLRIIQEALTNVKKHAGKCSVSISFVKLDNCVRVAISDDGAGFDPLGELGRNSYGLSIMRERAQGIGAAMEINSAVGKGTGVYLRVWGDANEDCNCR